MRILHLLDHSLPRHSAYALRTMAILRQQRAMGWHTSHLTGPRHGPAAHDRNRDGWHFFRTAPAAGALARLPLVGAAGVVAQRLRQVAQLTRPDLLHAHSPAANALAALRVGRRLGLPVVFEVHAAFGAADGSLRQRLAHAADAWCARRADAVAASSEGLRARLAAAGVPRARLTVVPNAVELRHYPLAGRRDAQLARAYGLGEGPVLAFIGAFRPHEGIDLLLDALPAMLQQRPRLQLLLAGSGAARAELQARVLRQHFGNSVVFAEPAAAGTLHALADLLVFPRLPLRQAELVPNHRLLEAMARGCLVVASDVGSHRELVEHGRSGMLFGAGQAAALADTVNVLLAAPWRWPAMRGEARWFVEYQRTWEISVARYAALYQPLLARRPRS